MHINTQILIAIYPQIIHVHLKSSFLSVFRSSQMATLPTSTSWWSLELCAPPPAMPACFCASPASGCQPTQRAKRPPSAPRPTLAPAAPRVASSCGSLTRRRDPPRSSCRTCQSGRRTVTAAVRPGPGQVALGAEERWLQNHHCVREPVEAADCLDLLGQLGRCCARSFSKPPLWLRLALGQVIPWRGLWLFWSMLKMYRQTVAAISQLFCGCCPQTQVFPDILDRWLRSWWSHRDR